MNAITTPYDALDLRRRELGISFSALAELSGVSQPALQRLLTGKVESPGVTSIASVARVLGMGTIRILDDGSIKFEPAVSAQALRERQARVRRPRGLLAWSRALPHSRVRR